MLNASQEVSSVEKKGRLMKDQEIHVCPSLRRFRENYAEDKKKIKKCRSTSLLSFMMLSLILCFSQGGCQSVDRFELIEKGNTEENIPLLSNDVIYIPNNKDQKVFVLGEVNKQSAIPIRERLTLLEAIAEAGGFTRDAKKESIVVMRGNLSEPEIMKIDAKRMDDTIRTAEDVKEFSSIALMGTVPRFKPKKLLRFCPEQIFH